MSEARLIDLETRMTFQEAALQSLSDTVTEQAQRLQQLELLCRALLERDSAAGGPLAASRSEEPPPHY